MTMIRLRISRPARLRAGLAALAALCGAALPAGAWGDKPVIDPAKGYVWTGDPCMRRMLRPEVRVITPEDFEAAIAEYIPLWNPDPEPGPWREDAHAASGRSEMFRFAKTQAEARKNLRTWLASTIYPEYAQVYCPENISRILAWAEQRDAETWHRLNPAKTGTE